jgi:beta-glucosidase
MDPIHKGCYPTAIAPLIRLAAPVVRHRDMDIIGSPIDFVGVNHHSRFVVKRTLLPFYGFRFAKLVHDNGLFTDFPWEVYCSGLTEILDWVKREYGNPPVYITENGAAFDDRVENERIHDRRRINYLGDYVRGARRVMREGCDVKGYFVWSLVDNFEWSFGFTKRFGLVHVDFESLARTIKDRGLWYAELCRNRTAAG